MSEYTLEMSSLARFSTAGVIEALQRRRYNRRQDTKENSRFHALGILACVDTLNTRGMPVPPYEAPSWAQL